jgi:5'-methylthioadenosine phosphorylase
MLGLITGSGFYDVPQLTERRVVHHATPFGDVELTFGQWRDGDDSPVERPVVLLARHGTGHSVPPHAINYRANVWALHEVGADAILATAVSGGISPQMVPGTLVLIDDFLNFTSGRADTFFDRSVRHTDMTAAYDPRLRALVAEAARMEGIDVVAGGT